MTDWTFSGIFLLVSWFFPLKYGNIDVFAPPQANGNISICNLTVNAGADKELCAPGGIIGLQGSVSGNGLYFQWSPASGLNNPQALNPVAAITSSITYTLTAYAIDPDNPNLIVNGNFEQGNTGFTSDYFYVADVPNQDNELATNGDYTVIHNPKLVHAGFSACSDHTNGNGNMMVINGAPILLNVWCQTVSVTPNSYYNVSAWVASVHPSSPALLRFSINNSPIGNTITAFPIPCLWSPFNALWYSGTNTTAEICILNLNTSSGGNDFALDDISITALCAVEDEININVIDESVQTPMPIGPAMVCPGEIATYTATFPPDPAIVSYDWALSSGGTIISGQGTSQITVLWGGPQQGSVCLAVQSQCNANQGCFDVTVSSAPAIPIIAGPSSLCPGEETTLYVAGSDPLETYMWTVPPEVSIVSGQGTNALTIGWSAAGQVQICLGVTNPCGSTANCKPLILGEEYLTQFDTIICEGTTFKINGTTYGNGILTGVETFTGVHGCDSLVEIEITESKVLYFMVTENLCQGESLFLEGSYQTQSGLYVDSFMTISNCDSIVYTDLIVSTYDTTWIDFYTCDPAKAEKIITNYPREFCDSTVIEETHLIPADTTFIYLSSCLVQDTGLVIESLSNQYGCDSLILSYTALIPILIDIQATSDYNGYGIACKGDNTGSATSVVTSGGTAPFTFIWSNGDVGPGLTNVIAGSYILTVTDANGCEGINSINVTEPASIQYEITTYDISCADQQDGSVVLSDISGGVSPLMTSLNGGEFQSDMEYENLSGGMYDLVIRDENGCTAEIQFLLDEPASWSVDLGDDTTIDFGDNLILSPAIHGMPEGIVNLSWWDSTCDGCVTRTVQPINKTTYSVTAIDENGCIYEDAMTVDVLLNLDVYIPNIFSPNNDQVNDHFVISSSAGLEEISELVIYDRWGNLVFEQFHFQPNDASLSWDGQVNGSLSSTGVYGYKITLKYKNGLIQRRVGDLTLIR